MAEFKPEFENPYPDHGWSEITAFEYKTPLILRRNVEGLKYRRDKSRDAQYIVAEDYRVRYRLDGDPTDRFVTTPQGMLTDLASAPKLVRPIVGKVGPHLEASIVHDFLYIAWQDIPDRGPRKADRRFADKLMLAAMKDAKVCWAVRWLIYLAVRSFVGWWVYCAENADRYRKPPDFD